MSTLFFTKSVAGILLAASIGSSPQLATNLTNHAQTPEENITQAEYTTTKRALTLQMCDDEKQESRACVSALIVSYAKEYGISKRFALALAQCESSMRSNVFGDSGRAYGIYQFHKPTFTAFAKKMGKDGQDLDYYNTEDNIKLAMWAIANNQEEHWSCYEKVAN